VSGNVSPDQLYLASLPGPAADGYTCGNTWGLLSPGVYHAIRRAAAWRDHAPLRPPHPAGFQNSVTAA